MPFVKIFIHFVWTTKNREPFLDSPQLRERVWRHILENSLRKGIRVDRIGGHRDHCHCLMSLGIHQSISKVMQLLKGESSYWINKELLTKSKFGWQDEYYGHSVSESALYNVRKYIENQEEHHRKTTFREEYQQLFGDYGALDAP